ncbi:MAG: hypothetical protein ACI9G1_005484 [Pirellulaceae bacterium]|jgi:hypothetical protein
MDLNPAAADNNDDIRTRKIPAGLMSAAVHVILLVALALMVKTAPSGFSEEGDRPGAIVLTQRSDNEQFEYLDEPEDKTVREADTAASEVTPPKDILEALPPEPAPSSLPAIDLPGLDLPTNNLKPLTTPSLDGQLATDLIPDITNNDAELVANESSRIQSSKPVGSPGKVSIFGSGAAEGHSFVFLFDRSQSMGSQGLGVLHAARKELAAAFAGLQPNHKFQVVGYNDANAHFGTRTLKTASNENKRLAIEFVGGLAAYGSTEHHAAVLTALNLRPDVIFLITDGGAPDPGVGDLREIHRISRGKTAIHCIRFGFGIDQDTDNFMRIMAQQNRGTFSYIDMNKRSLEE